MKTNYTREELIRLCDKAIVPYLKWGNRDTPDAQAKVSKARAYLIAGCEYIVKTKENTKRGDTCRTDTYTIWIGIKYYDFEEPENWHIFYIPTENSIKKSNGGDWY